MLSEPGRIQLLGTFKVQLGDRVLTRFRTHKAAVLLARLSLPPRRPYPREELLELLWPDDDPTLARNRLRVELSSLRHQLEPPGIAHQSILVTNRATIELNSLAMTTDAAAFHQAIATARQDSDSHSQCAHLIQAITLYQGELLPGFYEDWIETERIHLAENYVSALHEITLKLTRRQQYEEALEYGRRLAQADPYHEEFHCILIQLYIHTNQPGIAWQCYRDLEQRLQDELGVAPSPTTQRLVASLAPQKERPISSTPTTRKKKQMSQVQTPRKILDTTASVLPFRDKPMSVGRLPLQFTHFFGRQQEIDRLKKMLDPNVVLDHCEGGALVTLTGPGGSGKTRLALEAARAVRERFPAGAWFVSLADLTDAAQIPAQLHSVLRLHPHPNADRLAAISEALSYGPSLLVFDNLEHLEGSERVVQALREQTPGLTCLATARRPLGLPGEREFPVPPLLVPSATDDLCSEVSAPEHLMTFPSVQLFVDRAQSVRPDFAVTRRNAGDIAAICRQLEGIPLAVELAAARVRALTVSHMRARLTERFDLLVNPQADQAARHRSLRAALEWSYHLLSPVQRRLLAGLSVFRGGWSLDAAESVCKETFLLNEMEQLRFNSLILMEEEQETQKGIETTPRFRMLETMREFGSAQLSCDEQEAFSHRHAGYFLSLVEGADLLGSTRHLWSHRLVLEMDNIRVALEWYLGTATDESILLGLRLCHVLTRFWKNHGWAREGYQMVCALLHSRSDAEAQEDPARAQVWADAKISAGTLAWGLGEYDAAQVYLSQALSEFEMLADQKGMSDALHMLGTLRGDQDEIPAACAYLGRSLAIRQQLGSTRDIAATLNNLALALRWSEPPKSISYAQQAQELFREIGDLEGIAGSYHSLAVISDCHGDQAAALSALQESAALFQRLGEKLGMAVTLTKLGRLFWKQGDLAGAQSALKEGLLLLYQVGHTQGIAGTLTVIAEIIQETDPGRAVRLRSAGKRLQKTLLGSPHTPISEDKDWEVGWAMSLEQAIQEALRSW